MIIKKYYFNNYIKVNELLEIDIERNEHQNGQEKNITGLLSF